MDLQKEKLWSKDFILIMLINFFVFLNHLMILTTFPFYVEALHGTEAVAGLAAALFSVCAVVCRPFIGLLLDTGARRGVLAVGLIVMGLMPLGYMAVSLIVTALLCRMVHGIALAFSNTATNTVATDMLPKTRFAEGMGMFGTSIALATAFASAVGLFLMNRFGFTVLFLVSAGLAFFSLLLMALIKMPVVPRQKRKFSVADLVDGNAVPASVILFVFLLTFGALENFLAKFAVENGLPGAGYFFLIVAAVLMVARIATGTVVDRHGEGIFAVSCNALMFCAFLLLAFIPNIVTYFIAAIFVGYSFGCIAPALQAVAVRLAPPNRRGAANSTYLCAYDIGFGVGGGIAGGLISALGYAPMFAILSLANVVSFVLYLLWGRKHPSSFRFKK